MEKTVLLRYDSGDDVVCFAAQELSRYLRAVGVHCFSAAQNSENAWLPELTLQVTPALCETERPEADDAYRLDVRDLNGVVEGSNPRSVLLGSYRLLRELGFAFLRPDADGERIPGALAPHHVALREKAQNRYRGICIEGAVSFENVLALIDWMPKAGFNAYFTQFLTPYEFFKTWYRHVNNPLWGGGAVPAPDQVDAFVEKVLVPEMKRRGLLWQAVGHGFNTETLGLRITGWDTEPDLKTPHPEWMAQVRGQRSFFEGVPLNTNLCLSQPEVRKAFADQVERYLDAHPGVDLLHIWLADGGNNSCECPACSGMRPADWYIRLLNEVDARLTARHGKVKIAFLAYFDLLWPPEQETLKNPGRFVFMFAPITRSYRSPLPAPDREPLEPYLRNRARFPVSAAENMRYAREWKAFFGGDSFVYDYHYMWNHFRDWGDHDSARLLWQDLTALSELGFQGYVSCQQTRVFAPTGLGMYVMGRCLWGNAPAFETLAHEYFTQLFGSAGAAVEQKMALLSRDGYTLQPEDETAQGTAQTVHALRRAIATAEELRHMRPAADSPDDPTAWKYLHLAAMAGQRYLNVLLCRQEKRAADARQAYAELKRFLQEHEADWQEGFDLYWFVKNREPVLGEKS